MPIDYRQYPAHWKAIRARILARAGNHCEGCGVENHVYGYYDGERFCRLGFEPTQEWDALALDGYKTFRIVLTIAHLDHDKENQDVTDDRLAALCQACHLGHDREHHNHVRRMNRHGHGNPAQTILFRD